MTNQKIFFGPRLKRLRAQLGLTQAAMAQGLGVSASYLNLIERNQRPLTVPLMMKLASAYNITPDALSGDATAAVDALKLVFSDHLLEGELPGYEELFELAETAPNVTNGILKLHEAYRRLLDQISQINQNLVLQGESGVPESGSVAQQVQAAMADRPNYYPPLELAGAELHAQLNHDHGMWGALQNRLLQHHHIRVQFVPQSVMPDYILRFDKHTMRLLLSDRLDWPERQFTLAKYLAQLEFSDPLLAAVRRLNLPKGMQQDYARQTLFAYAGLAILLPYERFFDTAQRMRFDLLGLAQRFGLNVQMIARRISSLADPKLAGPNFSLIETNRAGQALLRLSSDRFMRNELSSDCARLGLYRALARPGELQRDWIETEYNQHFATLSYFDGKRAILMFLGEDGLDQTCYDDLAARPPMPIGVNCRLCERAHCEQRSAAPLIHPPSLLDHQRSIAPFDFDR